MKDFSLFSTFLFAQFGLFLSIGGNRPDHETHLGMARTGLLLMYVCVYVGLGGTF